MITTILNFARPVLVWIMRFLIGLIISNVVMWLLRYNLSNLLEQFNQVIKSWLSDKVNYIMTNILKINEWLDAIFNRVFTLIDVLVEEFEQAVETLLSDIEYYTNRVIDNPQIILTIDNLLHDILTQSSQAVYLAVQNAVSSIPFSNLTNITSNLITQFDNLKQQIDIKNIELWSTLIDPINSTVATNNSNISNLFTSLNAPVSVCNNNIETIESLINSACNQLDAHNNSLEQKKSTALQMIEAGTTKAELRAFLCIETPQELNTNFAQFRTNPPQINKDDYIASITLPDINQFYFSVSDYLPNLTELKNNLISTYTELNNLSQNVLNAIDASLPSILRGTLEAKLRNLVIISLTQAIYQLKLRLVTMIDEKITAVQTAKEEDKQEIVNEAEQMRNALQDFEQSQYDKIESLLSPEIEKIIQDITQGINETEQSIQVNVDDALPDTTELDSILTTFPNIPANQDPNITDSKLWDIADIYRILCNYFSRSERVALLILLFEQDLHINESKLQELQITWNQPN